MAGVTAGRPVLGGLLDQWVGAAAADGGGARRGTEGEEAEGAETGGAANAAGLVAEAGGAECRDFAGGAGGRHGGHS